MSLNTKRNSPFALFLGASVVLLVSALVYGQYGFNGELVRDDAIYLYSGQQMAKGIPPYVSIFDHKGPLAPLIAGLGVLCSRLFGTDDVLTVRVVFFAISALAVAGVYLLAFDLLASHQAGFFAAFTYLNFWGFGRHAVSGPRAKAPMVLFLVLALWLTARRKWFWAGVCGALAALTWQLAAIYPLTTVLLAAVQSRTGAEQRVNVLKAVAGMLVPVAVVSAYFLFTGAFYDLIAGAVTFNVKHLERGIPLSLRGSLSAIFRALDRGYAATSVLILVGLGLVVAISSWRIGLYRGDISHWLSRDRFAAVLLSYPLPTIWSLIDFQGYADLYILLPYAAIGFGWVLHRALSRHLGGEEQDTDRLPAGTLWVKPSLRGTPGAGNEQYPGREGNGSSSPHPRARPAIAAALEAAALWIICLALVVGAAWSYRQTTRLDQKLEQQRQWAGVIVSMFGQDAKVASIGVPEAMVLLHKTNPNPYLFIINGIDNRVHATTPGGFTGWLDSLGQYDPSIVLYGGGTRGRFVPELETWLSSRYQETAIGGWTVYVRHAQADPG